MEIDIKIDKWVQELLLEIKQNIKGYDVYLAGGYLRDQHCELPFKDLDVILTPNGEDRSPVLYAPKGYGMLYNKLCEGNDDMKKRGVEMLVGLYKRKKEVYSNDVMVIGGMICDMYEQTVESKTEVQYIVYDKPMTIEELADDMDMNINQVMWNPCYLPTSEGLYGCYCTKEFYEGHDGEFIEFSHWYDNTRMYLRQKRMIEKFPAYDIYDDIDLTETEKIDLAMKGEREYEGSA